MPALRITASVAIFLIGIILVAPITLIAMPFLLIAILTRAIVRVIEPKFVAWNEVIEFDPTIGWKPKRNLNAHYLTLPKDGVFHITTDALGWPGASSVAESDVVVVGDSFAFGYGVDIEDSFPAISRGLRIKAIGSPGYNMVQELLLLKQMAAHLRGKLAVWFICVENDLIDNLSPHTFGYRTPFVRRRGDGNGWEIVTAHLSRRKWHKDRPYQGPYLDILAKLCCQNPLSQRAYSACEFLIKEGKEVCSKNGAQLVVMTIPNAHQLTQQGREFLISRGADQETFAPGFPDDRIGAICRTLEIPFLAARTFLDEGDYKELDSHWNKRGHQRVSRALRELSRNHARRGHQEAGESAFGKAEFVEAV